jgi:hypothetical protein
LEKLHQTRHILRKEILKPPYLDSRLLREVAKTKQDSNFFFKNLLSSLTCSQNI